MACESQLWLTILALHSVNEKALGSIGTQEGDAFCNSSE